MYVARLTSAVLNRNKVVRMTNMPMAAERVRPVGRPAAAAWIDALTATSQIEAEPNRLLPDIIEEWAGSRGGEPALLSDQEQFTFTELTARMHAYSRWALNLGLRQGDRVALVMSNRPEYVAIWLGLSRIGVVTALINTSLVGPSLAHSLKLAAPRHVIVESKFVEASLGARSDVPEAIFWCHGGELHGIQALLPTLENASRPVSPAVPGPNLNDTALLIYTSGTTGLPKAARVSHRRILNWALWFKGMLGNTPADRMYDCLPLYHSVGGIVAVMATLAAGGSTVIAPRFSTSQFWPDVRRWRCTQFQYIGELCRYLLNVPPASGDKDHELRAMCGNGMRADVWEPFQARFSVPKVLEFYAATEGNFSLFNAEGKPGAIGRIPPFLKHRFPTVVVRFDPATGEPARGPDGLCIQAALGEPGEALGRIGNGQDGTGRFEGYTDKAESSRKILHNVLSQGDAWFRTGDLMKCDAAGYYYFVDRIGDTFRWKGENVSTLEVANVLAGAPGVLDAVVYGVPVPGTDGKAGMAMLQVDTRFDLAGFRTHAAERLPGYAVPLFLRLGDSLAATETFKHRKQDLIQQAFNPSQTSDALFAWNASLQQYVGVDPEMYLRIMAGSLRL
jgi:fatty-acyl-CoA synthase